MGYEQGGGGYGTGPREMHKAVCAECRRNAKFLLSPRMSVRYTARIAFQSARARVVKRRDFVGLFLLACCQRRHFKLFAGRYI